LLLINFVGQKDGKSNFFDIFGVFLSVIFLNNFFIKNTLPLLRHGHNVTKILKSYRQRGSPLRYVITWDNRFEVFGRSLYFVVGCL